MAKKKHKFSLHSFRYKLFISLLFIITIIIGSIFLLYGDSANAASSFYTNIVTPQNEVKRGGSLVFDVMVLDQKAGAAESTGLEFDKRKLRLDKVESGELGTVSWERISDNGDKSRIVITNSNILSAESNKRFARVYFTIIDQTDDKNEQGRGFVELCTVFDPGDIPVTPQQGISPQPTVAISGTVNPTTAITSIQNTPIPIPTSPPQPSPTPISASNLDMKKLCIPLQINGPSSEKMDMFLIPVNYESDQYGKFVADSQKAINQLSNTNLSSYSKEVLQKMNWYLLNTSHASVPATYRNKKIDTNDADAFLQIIGKVCPSDRYVVFIDTSKLIMLDQQGNPHEILGAALLYEGFKFAARTVDNPNSNVFTHEWGHAAAGLIDEYDAGKWFSGGEPTTGFNCTRVANNQNPGPDPCPWGQCDNTLGDPKFKTACAAWDCTQMECNDLQKKLFASAGCYQRCSSQNAYRASPLSIMDAYIVGAGEDLTKFNGPSLYSIIQYTFTKYF